MQIRNTTAEISESDVIRQGTKRLKLEFTGESQQKVTKELQVVDKALSYLG